MNFKTTLILLVLLIGAGVAVYLTNQSPPKEAAPDSSDTAETAKKLLTFSSSDVTQLSITPASGKQIVLKQDGMQWHMLEPVDAAADASAPAEILSDLTAMTSTGHVATAGADAAAVGLAPPQFKVEITTKDGHLTKLDVGNRSGTGDQLYVHLDGAAQNDLVQADVYDLLDKPVSEFRRKKLVDVSSTLVQHVEIDRPEGKLVLDKTGATWSMSKPFAAPADTTAVTDLILAAANLQASDFVSQTNPNPRRYGLDLPTVTVTLSNTAAATQPTSQPATAPAGTVVKFGMLDVRKQNAYVSTSDATAVALVSASSMETFRKPALDLRNKDVLSIDPASVSSITIQTSLPATTQPTTRPASQTSVTLERGQLPTSMPATMPTTASMMASTKPAPTHTVWVITSIKANDDQAGAKDSKVTALLSALHPLHVQQYDAIATTMPANADRYILNLQSPAPMLSTYHIELIDPGDSRPLVGRYNDLVFEVDRALLDKIKTDFQHDEPAVPQANPGASPGANPAMPGGFPPGAPG